MTEHISVLQKEVIDLLEIKENGVYVDCTLGAGGHSLKILEKLKKGKLYCFDIDPLSIQNFKDRVGDDDRLTLINDNFSNLKNYVVERVDGIIFDLGWSSDQLETLPGLSHKRSKDLLDMRFDQTLGVTAGDLLNALGKKELKKLFEDYADIRGHKLNKLTNEIVSQRKIKLFKTVKDLREVVSSHFPASEYSNLVSRVFQALRIAVNQELSILKKTLPDSFPILKVGGVLLIITFHSGEEVIVDDFIKSNLAAGKCEPITDSSFGLFIRPSVNEIKNNLRARSAKLFGVKKIQND
ncbi:MAG: ribosomal RNA small subunit methyltransferase H [Candidatus Dojkabacteria bacterium]|nr:MAG: ribosomal RNA small subunit methyltransferase H [Candidatus Dojkabacteria bacterium]